MQPYLPQVRADRLIAASRVLLAVFALIALQIDPDLLRTNSRQATAVLAAYCVYAALLVIVSFGLKTTPSLRLALLLADFGVYTAMVAITRGASSPFFVFFVFSMVCAALRFSVRGSVLMAVAAATVYSVLAVLQGNFLNHPGFVVLRLTYIAIIGILLTHFAAYLQRTTNELQQIAAWPRTPAAEIDDLLRQSAVSAAALLHAPQVVIVCDESDEPWDVVAELRDGNVEIRRVPPDSEIGTSTLPNELIAELHSGIGSGLIRFASPHPWSEDDRMIADIIGRLIGAQLDQFLMQDATRRAAVGEERLRLGRDLHDGLLQSLTGVTLGLEAVAQQTTDTKLAAHVRSLQEIIATDQHDLRAFVAQLRPGRHGAADAPLGTRLRALGHRMAMQWGIEVEVVVTPDAPPLSSAVVSEVYALVGEALANAAKHSRATHVRAHVTFDGDELQIDVEDNGHGFPIVGSYDLAALDAEQWGPVTLKERIVSLGGDLQLSSTPSGSRLEMRIEV